MYRGESISTKNKTFLLLIVTLLIFAVASVSASDVSDINDNQNYISVSEDSTSNLINDNVVLSSVDSNSGSSSDSISISKDVVDDSKAKSSVDDSSSKQSSSSDSSKKSSADDSSSKQSSSSDSSKKSAANDQKNNLTKKVSTSDSNSATKTSIVSNSSKVVRGNSYSVTLKDKNGNVLSGKKLIFTFNGNNYTRTTDAKGIASLTLNCKVGSYAIVVTFLGDSSYQASSLSGKVDVSGTPTTIKTSTSTAVNGKSYSVVLKDNSGNPISSRQVSLSFNGKTYNVKTNANGIASITLSGTPGNTYKLTFKFAGDNTYAASSGSASLYLKKATKFVGSDARIVRGKQFSLTLKDADNKIMANKQVTILLNGKTYTRTTNAKGNAVITLSLTPKKYYNLTFKFAGASFYNACSKTVTVFMKSPTTLTNSGSVICKGNPYKVTLKDFNNDPIANKRVSITFNGVTYSKVTDSKGVASLTINAAAGKTYNFSYKFAEDNWYGASSGSIDVRNKLATTVTGTSSTHIKGSQYNVTLKDSTGKAIANKIITYTFNGKIYNRTTNAKGIASLKISVDAGKTYKLSFAFAGDSNYNKSSSGDINLAVKLASSIKNSGTIAMNGSTYTVTLLDGDSKAMAGKTITFTLNGKTYTNTTDSKGVAHLHISEKALGTYKLTYKFAGDSMYVASSGSVNLNILTDKYFTFNQIVAAAKNLRSYVEKNGKVPATVTVNGITLNLTTFGYLMAKALVNVNNGKKINVDVLPVDGNYSNNGKNIKGNLYKEGYLNLSNSLISYVQSNKRIPFYITTNLGAMSPNLYIFGLSKALDFYASNNYLPNYLIMDSNDVNGKPSGKGNASQYKKGLNEIESLSESELAQYLKASGNDAIDSAIQKLANSLVAGKTSAWDKANAIFTWVRDNINYEYYANTKYKASGTLSKKKGNCCDHANLIVSLCRAAGIAARFSHAQGCRFSSGLVTGHIWAQIYVDGVWYSADATSSRNELGNIHNWNTNSFNSLKQYVHLPF